ncbi:RNA-binding domain-containing protein [Xylaria intraflava]|nr:RNA-binding domain-containing protein [Xylaria intraflava]
MHCVRRAVVRAACSSSRTIAAPRQQVGAIALQISKANVNPVTARVLSRYFSWTAPAAQQDEESPDSSYDGAASNGVNALESSLTENERAAKTGASIFISNMTYDATETHLDEAFSKYGEITQLNIARDGRGMSRGFGFITFDDKQAADRAVHEANNSFWHGRRITVAHRQSGPTTARPGVGPSDPTSSLYIGNIPYESSDAELNQLFRSLDGVKDVRVAVDRNTGWPRGFAHADFVDVEHAEKARDYLAAYKLGGRQLRIDFSTPRSNFRSGRD